MKKQKNHAMIILRLLLSMVFCLGLSLLLPACQAHIGEMDDVWAKRGEEARAASLEAYHPYPDELTDDTNMMVHQATDNNSTRRHLRKYTGACLATNPIDRCWRCRPDWANDRKRLAKCALGFGRKTIGGKFGNFYVVTDASDNDLVNPKPGSLRHAVIQNEPLWILFARDMIIRLNEKLIMNGHKTIDARGSNVHIAHGAGIAIQYVKNVILHGLHIHDISVGSGGMIRDSVTHYGFRTQSDGDGVSIYGSTDVWVDHLSMSNCKDGLIDTIEGSTAVTVSNNHFTNHNEVMLMGASDANSADAIMQITVAFNHFGRGLIQRMPRCRWGFSHVLNNDYTHWLMYAVGGSKHPTIISQGNRYIAPPDINAKEVTKRDYAPESEWMKWSWRSEGDLFMNGAFFRQSGSPRKKNQFSRQDFINAKPGSYVRRLTRFSGSLVCKVGLAC